MVTKRSNKFIYIDKRSVHLVINHPAILLNYNGTQESGDPVRQKVVAGASGLFPDCWSARQAIFDGKFAAICDETTMKKAMAWDFR